MKITLEKEDILEKSIPMIQYIEVNGHKLEFIRYPKYKEAHPHDDLYITSDVCTMCCIARRLDTNEEVLLWLVGHTNWSVSLADKNYEKHKLELQ